jgi:hypothetical protein
MEFHPANLSSVIFFVIVVLSVLGCLLWAIWNSRFNFQQPEKTVVKIMAAIGIWLGISSALVKSGFVSGSPMPNLIIFFISANAAAAILGFSRMGKAIACSTPVWILILFQSFRLPLELVLHSWALQGTIPETMTWTGRNFDIIAGISALICAPLAKKSADVAWLANIIGIVSLLNVARVALFSSPLPFAWKVDPPLQLAMHLPYSLIATVCVAGALAGHIILTRALIRR